MNQTITPRWEWRSFGQAFDRLDAQLPSTGHASRETYVVCDSSSTNVKIRDAVIDVKVLDRVSDGLELWTPAFKAPFPIGAADIRTVFAQWPLPSPPALELHYTPLQLVGEVFGCSPQLHVIGVTKVRRQAVIDQCIVELSSIGVGGRTVQTASIEMVDADQVLRLVRALRFEHYEPLNYVTFLKRMLRLPTRPSSDAPSEGACHENPALPLVSAPGVADRDDGIGASI